MIIRKLKTISICLTLIAFFIACHKKDPLDILYRELETHYISIGYGLAEDVKNCPWDSLHFIMPMFRNELQEIRFDQLRINTFFDSKSIPKDSS